MHVLQLAPKEDSPPFELQVRALEARGIECTTVTVPGSVGANTSRSVLDYLRFHPTVLRESFGAYDLIHANYGLTAPAALAQPRLPVVLSLWGSDLDGELGWVSRYAARFCDARIVMSERMQRNLDQPCHVIPHGVEMDVFEPQPRREAIAELGWNPTAQHVLFPYKPGRSVKNYDRAARVVDTVRESATRSVRLQTAEDVPHEQMPLYMNAADCLLLTSEHEGSPNVVKEAIACNLPVVSTDVGDVRERLAGVVPSAVCETDAALAEAVATILDRGRRSNGREQATEIDVERMAARMEAVYREVVGEEGVADSGSESASSETAAADSPTPVGAVD